MNISLDSFIMIFNQIPINPQGLTCAGRCLNEFSVVCAHDHSVVGAWSLQQGVHSHSDIFR